MTIKKSTAGIFYIIMGFLVLVIPEGWSDAPLMKLGLGVGFLILGYWIFQKYK